MADGIHRAGQHLLVQALFVKHHVRLYDAAALGAAGHTGAVCDEIHIVEPAAAGAVVAQGAAVQLVHGFAACRLMQAVNVLGDHCPQLALLLQLCQPQMGGVGLCPLYDQLVAVKTVKFLRVFLPEGMAEDGFGRVVVFLVVQPVHAAEIRDAALRRNARTAEKDDAAAFCNNVFQCLDHS